MRPTVLALFLAFLLAGCGGSSATLTEKQLGSLVLQRDDLPQFEQFQNSAQGRPDADIGPRHDPGRFDRSGGWIARYRRTGASLDTPGPLVVVSRADLFPSAGDAKQDLDAYATAYGELGGTRLDAPSVGDSAVAFSYGSGDDNFFLVAWRHGNVTASVVVEGASVELADATALARKQDAHIDAAAKSDHG